MIKVVKVKMALTDIKQDDYRGDSIKLYFLIPCRFGDEITRIWELSSKENTIIISVKGCMDIEVTSIGFTGLDTKKSFEMSSEGDPVSGCFIKWGVVVPLSGRKAFGILITYANTLLDCDIHQGGGDKYVAQEIQN